MTRKLDFKWKWDNLIQYVHDSESQEISDVDLMIKLKFSPPSWKVWKPKFIEKAGCTKLKFTKQDRMVEEVKISYNKKRKLWFTESLENYYRLISNEE